MKSFIGLVLLAFCASTSAYPGLLGAPTLYGRDSASASFIKAKRVLGLPPPLNISGIVKIPDAAHPFRAPGPGDQRGPCPGLNVLANHGYINRTGVTTIGQAALASQEAFNMEYEVGVIFSFLAVMTGGNIETQQYSIGGPSDLVTPFVSANGSVLLKPVGMGNSHPHFEGDTSLTRLDWGVKNDSYTFNQKVYDGFVDHAWKYGGGKFDQKVIGEYRYTRYLEGNRTTKGFLYTTTQAFVNGGASYLFYGCYKNGTANYATLSNMNYFVGSGNLKYEQFPPNWYRGGICALQNIVTDARLLYGMHPVPFKEGFLQAAYRDETTVNDFACHTLNYVVGGLTPKGTGELDQRIGAALGEWGPYLGGIFATKFGCK